MQTIRGLIPEADQDAMTFHVIMADGKKIEASMRGPHREKILEAFQGYQSGVRVQIVALPNAR